MDKIFIYDGECGFCRRVVHKVQSQDLVIKVQYAPYQQLNLTFYGLTETQARSSVIFIINDQCYYGAAAFSMLLQRSRKIHIRTFAKFINLPFISLISKSVYSLIANNRYLFSKIFFKK